MKRDESQDRADSYDPHGIVQAISTHALDQWMDRTGSTNLAKAAKALQRALGKAFEVQLKPRFRATARLNHGLQPARYLRSSQWLFVVSLDGTVLTCHAGSADRWEAVK